jgi:transposase
MQRVIKHRIARRSIESKHRLGQHGWKVKRTFAWLARYGRLTIRYERLVDMHRAFLHRPCALVCCNYVLRS